MAIIGNLKVLLGLDTAGFTKGLGDARRSAGEFSGKLTGLSDQAKNFGKVFGTVFTVGAITAAIGKATEYAGKLQDLAAQTGLTTDTLQEMAYAAKQTGSSLDAFTNAAFKLGINLAGGSNSVEGAVAKLGLSFAALQAMSPDEQFNTITKALGGVQDAQERNRLGVLLFGKSFKEVASAVASGYDEMASHATKAGEAQVNALADAGDAVDDLWDRVTTGSVQALGTVLIAIKNFDALDSSVKKNTISTWDWASALQSVGLMALKLPKLPGAPGPSQLPNSSMSPAEQEAALKKLDGEVAVSFERNKAAAEAAKEFAKALRQIGGADAISGAQMIAREIDAIGGPLKVLPSDLKHLQEGLLDGAEAARLVGNVNLAEKFERMAKALDPITVFQERYNVKIGEFVPLANSAADAADAMWEQFFRLSGEVITIEPARLASSMDLSKMFEPLKKGFSDNLSPSFLDKAWGGMKVGLSKNLGDISQTIANAFTGGGDIMGALKSIVSQIGSTIGAGIGSAFGPLGAKIGSAIGSLSGQLVPAFKKLFGIGQNDELKKFNAKIDESKQKLLEQYGSLERIDRIGKIVGVDLAAAWKSQGEAGKKHFDELAQAFDKAIDKMVDDAQKGVDDANSALSDLRGELDGAISDARALGYEFDKTGKFVGVSFDKAKSTADEFGVSMDGLGPILRQQGIDSEAKRIINAFTLLDKAGGDTGGILVGMKDEIGKLVGKSIELGTTIPANMKPWIQNLIDTHQLLDENGKEITDIGKIKFGSPIETQFDTIQKSISDLVGKIDALIDKITNELIPALEEATRDRNTHFTYTADPIPQPPGTVDGGGGDERTGEPGTALGTKGRFGNWFHNWGHETANTMHGIEAVVRQDQAVPFAMDVLGGLGAGASAAAPVDQRPAQIHVQLENIIQMDGVEYKRFLKNTILSAVDNNENGFRTDLLDLVGVKS
jgi:hypothetical protein